MSYPSTVSISVIIPTTCETSRAGLLERALGSVLSQRDTQFETIVVVNGDRFDPRLLEKMKADPRLRILQLAEGNVSRARFAGTKCAQGDLFCFLDDDDELLPEALKIRVDYMDSHPGADALVTNGLICERDEFPLVDPHTRELINANVGASILHKNWFASPSSTFRKKTIPSSLLDFEYAFFEWTYLFFTILAAGKSIRFLDTLTYRKYEDNPLSVSKTKAYFIAYPDFLHSLMKLPLEASVRRELQKKYLAALNSNSGFNLEHGRILPAAIFHFQCLKHGGWRYVPYSRKILFALLHRLSPFGASSGRSG
jgi:glycosyltransferase involved in cell wall biosynthesis